MELDVAEDSPQGGRFAQSAGLQIAGIDGYTPAKTNPKLLEPGFKVLHIPDFDFNSHCTTLKECLQIIKQWSDSNPTHLPFSLYIELKEANVLESTLGDIGMQLLNNLLNASTAPGPGVTIQVPEPTAATLIALQEEILSVLGIESILTPDDVREMLSTIDAIDYSATKLNELLLKPRPSSSLSNNNNVNNNTTTCPWPPLSLMQGKILLPILLTRSARVANYNTIWPNAKGSIFWPVLQTFPVPNAVFKSAGIDSLRAVDETFTKKVAAIKEEVNSAVGGGYIVRARADADTVEARAGRTERRDALLLETGTHVVATDYVIPRVVVSSVKSVDSNGNGLTSPLSASSASSYAVSLPGCATGQCVNVDEAERGSIDVLISTEDGEVVVCEDDSSYFACLLSEHRDDYNSGGGGSDTIQGNPSSSLRWDSSLFNVVNAVVLIVFGMIL